MRKAAAINFIKKYWLDILLSFVLPVVLLGIAYAMLGIYWNSDRSILASDSFPQYSNFHASFNNVLKGKANILYSWSGSLGLNYIALMGYYLNGLFTPLVGFFDNIDMPNALYLLTLLKIGAGGITFWVYAHNTYKIKRSLNIGLTVCYALMSYAVAYSVVIMWLDTFVYLPLITLGINRLMDKKKPLLLFISYVCLFISNFYMAFMAGVFSFLYYVFRLFTNWRGYRGSILSYLLTAFTAGGISMITILPTILDLRNNGEALTQITQFFTKDVGPWDLVAKNLTAMYDTSKFGSMAFIYIGLLPLLFFLFYFVTKQTPLKNKILFGSMMLSLCASIYIEPLNLFWHGLHAPNMFLFRFSFTISFLVIILAGYGLERFSKEELNRFTNLVLAVGGVFLAFFLFSNKRRYGEITTQSLIVTFLLLAIYLGLIIFWKSDGKFSKWRKLAPVLMAIVICGEMFFNNIAMLQGIAGEWYYPATSLYQDGHADTQKLVDTANESEDSFFRLENQASVSMNDSFNYGYSGVTMFSSIRNRNSSDYLNNLGFRSAGTNLNINYSNNTLLADSLMGIHYNIAKENPLKFGYTEVEESGEHQLYENAYALPIGLLTDDEIYDRNKLRNQTEILNHLAGTEGEMVTIRDATIVDSKNVEVSENDDGTITLGTVELNQAKELHYVITLPAHTQGYMSLVPADYSDVSVIVEYDDQSIRGSLLENGQYYNLGYYEEPVTLEVTVTLETFDSSSSSFRVFTPDLLLIDTEKYADVVTKAQENGVEVNIDGNTATAEVTAAVDQVFLTTIPNDKGWKAYVDGDEVDIKPFKDAFISFDVAAGTHDIKLVFIPQGMILGGIIALICLIIFIAYFIWLKKRGVHKDES